MVLLFQDLFLSLFAWVVGINNRFKFFMQLIDLVELYSCLLIIQSNSFLTPEFSLFYLQCESRLLAGDILVQFMPHMLTGCDVWVEKSLWAPDCSELIFFAFCFFGRFLIDKSPNPMFAQQSLQLALKVLIPQISFFLIIFDSFLNKQYWIQLNKADNSLVCRVCFNSDLKTQ